MYINLYFEFKYLKFKKFAKTSEESIWFMIWKIKDPSIIMQLTWESFADFHMEHIPLQAQ